MSDEQIIELDDGEGGTFRCQLLQIFDFEEKEYALLLNLETESPVVMHLISESDDEGSLHVIEDDEEFARVTEYLRSLYPEDDAAQA